MQAMIAEKALMKSSPLASSANVSTTTVHEVQHHEREHREDDLVLRRPGPPIFTGRTACGCTSSISSRPACRNSTSVRNILMPPPVEPVFAQKQDSIRIHIGTNTGQTA